ncbi:hypothetical protein JNUCC1_01789 [Lentibacillus sp. JNUCC-1]|uniref:hypothetical protein n=1 Tax=Lentibacillus sp. JNUCC-1 TaxID=2654513 RepID=UPI0012E7F46D|nr:hypothetical protein [Lentibacillus sp. JNUCC-1]MUV37981.1 hypothetical protein [Lentibacillus sp. JNUCC-1]
MKKSILFLVILLSVSVIGCQDVNHISNQLNLTEDIPSIEVYKWDMDTLHTTIKDPELIMNLVKELNIARTYSTADMDYPLPDYKLVFKDGDNGELFQIGYYKEVVKLGVKGRYLDVSEDIMYQVELQLPI